MRVPFIRYKRPVNLRQLHEGGIAATHRRFIRRSVGLYCRPGIPSMSKGSLLLFHSRHGHGSTSRGSLGPPSRLPEMGSGLHGSLASWHGYGQSWSDQPTALSLRKPKPQGCQCVPGRGASKQNSNLRFHLCRV
ncbi:hypothetical protein DPEC_G00216670 [Dallia pectoralis]|uniref:Uncharacterized protein n=1 Tax=Dallia pectoralis TaxID=75939 RepID=A0ACC2G2J6_DALPE|nr:hypothetical protein DPEC_G00216670 [Dallia pectoralis]